MGRRFESCRKRKIFNHFFNQHLNLKNLLKKFLKDFIKKEGILFYIGLFLLPSAFSLAVILFLFSLIISFRKNNINYFDDKFNIFFLIAGFFLFVSSLINFFNPSSVNNLYNNSYLIFLGLLNWIPQIIFFISFQKYLVKRIDREWAIMALISGTIPVIVSCIGQAFNWHGPMRALFGLLVWYQRPIDGITGITGLFNNPNYLGAWLNIIWPFSLALLFFDKKNFIKVFFKLTLSVTISTLIVLTASRSAWLCLLIPIPFIFGTKFKKWIFSSITFLTLLIINLSFPLFGIGFQSFLRKVIPSGIWFNFTNLGYESLDLSRLNIWEYAYKFILENPILGFGSRSFPILIFNETGIWKGHSHNLPLELMVSYGIPATLMLLIPIIILVFRVYLKLFFINKKINQVTILDRAWVISLSILILMHLVDIQYFDGRVSIIGWILLAGTKNILLVNTNEDESINI